MSNRTIVKYNILYLIDTTGHGGAETVLKSIIGGLDRTRYMPFVLLNDSGWLYEQLSTLPNTKVFVFNGRGRFNVRLIWHVRRIIRQYKIDIIHTHLFGASLYGNLSSFFLRKPVICTLHGIPDWPADGLLNKIKLTIIYAKAKKVVFVSRYLQKHFENLAYIRLKKTKRIVYNGVSLPQKKIDINEAKENLGFRASDILISSVGNIQIVKGFDILLKSAETVIGKYHEVKFLVAGVVVDASHMQELLRLLSDLKLENSFFFIGYQKNVEAIYQASDLFVLPSRSEGFSLSIVEAMSYKVPIIATKSGGPEEIIENNFSGKLVAPEAPDVLAHTIIEVLEDYHLQRKISRNAYNVFCNRFTELKMIHEYQRIYANIK